jgi:hypothetical protein
MAIPSIKDQAIDTFIEKSFKIRRVETIHKDVCVICKKDAKNFKDELSKKEYSISGICQNCQDNLFA